MTETEIQKHADFLRKIGVSNRDIEDAVQYIRGRQSGEQVAWRETALPFLPAAHLIEYIENEGRQMSPRSRMRVMDDEWHLCQRAEFYHLAASITGIARASGKALIQLLA